MRERMDGDEANREDGERGQELHETALERRDELVRVAARLLDDPVAAEDVVQDVLLGLLERDDPSIEIPQAWLHRVTSNRAIDRRRRANLEREIRTALSGADAASDPLRREDVPSPERALSERERCREAIRVLLEGSGSRDTAAALLREVFGFDHATLARASGRGEAACRQAVSRTLARARHGRPGDGSRNAATSPASPTTDRSDTTLRRFERAVIERDPAPLLGALDISAVARTTGLRVDANASGLRLSLVLDGIVLCILPSRRTRSSAARAYRLVS